MINESRRVQNNYQVRLGEARCLILFPLTQTPDSSFVSALLSSDFQSLPGQACKEILSLLLNENKSRVNKS